MVHVKVPNEGTGDYQEGTGNHQLRTRVRDKFRCLWDKNRRHLNGKKPVYYIYHSLLPVYYISCIFTLVRKHKTK